MRKVRRRTGSIRIRATGTIRTARHGRFRLLIASNLRKRRSEPPRTLKQTFDYDRFGNRTFDAANTTTISVSNTVTNPSANTSTNRLNGHTYDPAGNLTIDAENKRFVYDAESHQTKLFGPTNNPLRFWILDWISDYLDVISGHPDFPQGPEHFIDRDDRFRL